MIDGSRSLVSSASRAPLGIFPFGEPVCEVVQTDRSPKRIFVLGVYASAVHARWCSARGGEVVKALAVASEPYIFWRGEGAGAIIGRIAIPEGLGALEPADPKLNGPSGVALDEWVLRPLGLKQEDAWLCDLVPHSCMNARQRAAIARAYHPAVEAYGLPAPSVPDLPRRLTTEFRRQQILAEIASSGAETLVLLGDQPVQWFLSYYDARWHRLRDFGTHGETYGVLHRVQLGTKTLSVLPLAHPHQIAKLGLASDRWYDLHQAWVRRSGRR